MLPFQCVCQPLTAEYLIRSSFFLSSQSLSDRHLQTAERRYLCKSEVGEKLGCYSKSQLTIIVDKIEFKLHSFKLLINSLF